MARFRLSSLLARSSATLIAAMALALGGITPLQNAYASANGVVISQVYGGGGNTGAPFKNDFIEVFNAGASPVSLNGWSVQYAAATGTSWQVTNLTNVTLQPGQRYLVQEAAGAGTVPALPTPDATGTIPMAAAAGKVALVNTTTPLTGAPSPIPASVVDFVGFGVTANTFEGTGPAPAPSNSTADLRLSGAGCTDANDNSTDFTTGAPAPHNTASAIVPCSIDLAPSVISKTPTNGASSVAPSANINLTFSEPVNVAAGWYDITCAASGSHSAAVSGGPVTFTINPDVSFTSLESCTVTIAAAHVTDQDTNDPPDTMSADVMFSFTVGDTASCGTPATAIHAVQGSGSGTPVSGTQVTIEGVVTGDYQGSGGLEGFYIQEEDADADSDPQTSEGLFIFDDDFNADVVAGDVARVTGYAVEFSGQTELSSVSSVLVCGTASQPAASDVTLPFATASGGEPFEGMLVRMHQTLTVSEVFDLGHFGEVLLSAGGRLRNPTNVLPPGPDALALREFNFDLNSIVLDDGTDITYPDPTPFLFDGPTLRLGDTVDDLTGVFGYAFGTYRIEPVGSVPFVRSNPRTAGPEDVGGTLKIAALNVLNFFNGNGSGGGFPTPRGANTQAEFTRQKAKTIAAIVALNPDVAGMMEMENDDTSTQYGAIEELVDGLNAATAPGTYAFIDTGHLGTDEIRVAVIYKPSMVTPVGPWATITTGPFTDKSRPPVAQAFEENATGEQFIFVVNHLKSKGSCPTSSSDPNADQGDLQGCWNPLRVDSVNLLLDWLENDDPTGTGDPDILLMGDMNAYAREDPITAFESRGYTNLIAEHIGEDAYSYVFDGESGYLDHAIGSTSVVSHVTGVAEWHNNADEPIMLDYNVENKSPAQQALNTGTPYRASDHDPVIIGLTLGAPAASVSPTSHDFGDQLVGSPSSAETVTITNDGTLPLEVGTLGVTGDFALDSDTCSSASVDPTESCTVDVTFTPTSTGAKTGTLSIPSNAASSPDTVSLSGNGVQPGLSVTPTSIDFGSQLVGSTSSAHDITLTNDGSATVNVSAISASGDFALSGGTCASTPFSLAVGASCTVGVTFTPSATGARTGTFSASSDAPGSPDTSDLSGTGVQPGLSVTPTSIDFGSQLVGSTSSAHDITISNDGTASVSISAISASGDFALSGGTCAAVPFSLAVGASCTVGVTFTPSATGARTGTFSASSDAPGSPDTSDLSGTGVQPGLAVTPGSLTFGSQVVGTTSAAQNATLTNDGTSSVSISAISASGDFALSGGTCASTPFSLAVGASCTVGVTFTPSATGARTGTFRVSSDAPGSPDTASLAGTGILANLLVNGGFEIDANHDHVPDNWMAAGLKGLEGQDCTVAHSGSCSLRLDDKSKKNDVSQVVTTTGSAGDHFQFNLWTKALNGKGKSGFEAVIVITYTNGHKATFRLKLTPGTYDWKISTLNFTAAKAYKSIKVTLSYGAKDIAWFDDASLVRTP